ncbi:sorting nexin-32 isoform X6 [Rattus norvegicus]|uniref:sorting nexin-32 isoform X6 n=1 Tax=Rattus norvegicus TaxID=10116 RepID=UPI002FD7C448
MSQLRRIMEEHQQEAGKESKPSSTSVDLQGDSPLQVEISDAVSERDKVKFTVQTKSGLPHFAQPEFSVVRQHEEFIWLHDTYVENEEYAGLIIPPAPPRPDFEASREKLQKLGEGNSSITREEFARMKQELEAEYLAIFKKTVAMHEIFLQRLAAHPTLRRDHNLSVFLEYSQDLSVREKNRKEVLGGFLKSIVRSADEVLITGISGLKEVDDFFEHERTFLVEYHTRIRDTCQRADRVMHSHKCLADNYIPLSAALSSLGTQAVNQLKRAHGLPVSPGLLFPEESHRVGRAGAQARPGECSLPMSSFALPLFPQDGGGGHVYACTLEQWQGAALSSQTWGQGNALLS